MREKGTLLTDREPARPPMPAARTATLSALRNKLLEAVPRPEYGAGDEWQRFEDVEEHFEEILTAVGGTAVRVPDAAAADAHLRALPAYADAAETVSLVSGVGESTAGAAEADDVHDLADVGFAVLPAKFGVAENGAVWVDFSEVRHRGLSVLAEHLAVVLPAGTPDAPRVEHTMHEAYARLADTDGSHRESFGRGGFGLFLSGPSKTADIEQSLVIGAHGARSLTVYLVGP